MNPNKINKTVEGVAGFDLPSVLKEVLELVDVENRMYDRLHKDLDHILSFLCAGNVSEAMIEVSPGVLELLDKRSDKPVFKDSEIAEAAKAIQALRIKVGQVDEAEDDDVVAEATHVISEIGDVIYNILQLAALANLGEADHRRIKVPEFALASIDNLFSKNDHQYLLQYMANVGIRKFNMRYVDHGRKDVEAEEIKLVKEFGALTLEVIKAYWGLYEFIEAVKGCLYDLYAVCIMAANDRDHILKQMLQTGSILEDIYSDKEVSSES